MTRAGEAIRRILRRFGRRIGHHVGVPELITPTVGLRSSFLAAVAEFRTDPDHPVPWFVTDIDPPALTDTAAFTAYIARVVGERTEETARSDIRVPMTTFWWADGDEMLGRLAIRHRLTPKTEKVGGHIGYNVRPGARRRGHATAMLAAALPLAGALGITSALLTCDETNTGSRHVIESNGGVLIDLAEGRCRYRVPTGRLCAG